MEMAENRIVVDSEWLNTDPQEQLRGAGYVEELTGKFVPEESAYQYALEQMAHDMGLRQEFVDWFYREWEREE